jgi:tetraacyldisaccharide 4'-kinase
MRILRKLLLPISILWGVSAYFRNLCYDYKIFKTYKVSIPVISIGNIHVGGTGKTPLTICLAKHFSFLRVAIVTRGYGDGDEVMVMQKHLPKVKIYVGSDRVASAKKAELDGAELILLEDGFQHRRLERDIDIVLLRGDEKSDYFLPAGNLREHPRRLKSAWLIDEYKTKAFCNKDLKGKRVAVFCGIAHPERFLNTVKSLGAIVVSSLFLRDHQAISKKNLLKLSSRADYDLIVCTEKDEVKLKTYNLPIISIGIEIDSTSVKWLLDKIAKELKLKSNV